jgi:hypothetical protein
MKILIAEYAVARNIKPLVPEGRAILSTLVESFRRAGHDVIYPERVRSFGEWIKKNADRTDAGLVVAPDELLADFVEILEEKTTNLGCSPECIRLCADKLRTTEILEKNGVRVPGILSEGGTGKYVIKPRFGCGSEGVEIIKKFRKKRGFITCKFIDGKHISASIIVGKTTLPLTINKQRIKFDKGKISYDGGVVPYEVPNKKEIFSVASKTAKILGCGGYVGIDIVLQDETPFVVDVNPRPTTSIVGIARVINHEIADLILKARFGKLPMRILSKGRYSITKKMWEGI